MRVALVNPLGKDRSGVEVHMSVLYLATHLHRCGHKVKVIDAQLDDAERLLKGEVKRSDLVAFSVMTTQTAHALRLSDMAKGIDPDVPVCWGGIHPTLFPEQTVGDRSVDFAIRGEGELTAQELLKHIAGKMKAEKVRGLAYNDGKGARINPERPYLDLNTLSPPEWKLIDVERYAHDFIIGSDNYGKSLPIHSGRGCIYRCSFCINTVQRKKWRALSADKVLEEAKLLKERYGVRYVKFVDENFFLDKKRVLDFSKSAIKEGLDIEYHATTRVDNISGGRFSEKELGIIRKSGFVVASMGVESGSQNVLDILKKDITVEQVIDAVKLCKRFDIKPICSFMIGLPGERKSDMIATLRLITRIRKIAPDALIIGPQVFRPYPGADLYDEVRHSFREPRNTREWADADILSGYTTTKHLPWVKDPEFVDCARFYVDVSQPLHGSVMRKAVQYPFKIIAESRLRHNIFKFTLDKSIYERFKDSMSRGMIE